MEYMPSSLPNPVLSTIEKNWTVAWCGNKICDLVLCNAQSPVDEASTEGIHNPSFAGLSKNDCVAGVINDIKDKVFWKAICYLLCAVFPALKGLQYCDSNIPAMEKIFFDEAGG